MNNYNNRGGGGFNKNQGGFGGRHSSYGGDKRGGANKFGGGRDRDDRQKEMHSATCASCQKMCQVPFRPSGDKPVYCSDCFSKQNGGGDRDRGNNRPQFDNRFPARREHSNDKKRDSDGELKQRLATIETKLNKILDLINSPTKPEKSTVALERKTASVKKEVDKPALKEAVEKATAPKKVGKKAIKKKVAKKTVVKKVVKKSTKTNK